MSHFAQIKNGIVVNVINAEQDFINSLSDNNLWIQTSYNTIGNKHITGGTPLRGNYAGIGYTYDAVNDVFIAPQPYASWTLNIDYLWESPVTYPTDGKQYTWNEDKLNWVEL